MNVHSLRFRMAVWYAGVLGVCLVLFRASVYLGLSGFLNRSLRNSLLDYAQSIGDKLLGDVNFKGEACVVGELNEMTPMITSRFMRVRPGNSKGRYVSA